LGATYKRRNQSRLASTLAGFHPANDQFRDTVASKRLGKLEKIYRIESDVFEEAVIPQ